MKKTAKIIALFTAVFAFAFMGNAQDTKAQAMTRYYTNYVFDADSLAGFNENSAHLSSVSEGFLGTEYNVHMFTLKRQYINAKYNLIPGGKKGHLKNAGLPLPKVNVAPACDNEDFELSAAGPITQNNQIQGWTCSGGNVYPPYNSCNNSPWGATLESELIDCPAGIGYIDPVIGGVYPIFSVFGNGGNNGNPTNPQIPIPMGGTKVLRVNNEAQNYSAEKLTKSFNVTPNNALFQFAFISVFSTGHTCCDAGAFNIKLTNVSGGNTIIPCPQFSVAAPSTQCTTNTPVGYFLPPSGNPYVGSGSLVYSKWNINSLDLSAYLGSVIQIDIIVTDCNAGGHYGTIYFDAQCSPMTIIGNGNGFPAGTPSITLPTCGANGATITAPAGLGPYSWNSGQITIPANLTIPNYTNTTLITNQSGTVMLTMNPPGSCQPINKVITVSITPAPIALASAIQTGCTNTLSAASLTAGGSASVNPVITWSPVPGSLSNNSLTATGLPVGITTITVQDVLGCKVTVTLNILPAPPPVTFSVSNLTGSYSITCINPTINLQAITNYTYGSLTYSWTSPSFTANTPAVGINQPNTLTVTALDPVTGCQTVQVVTVNQFTTQPTNTVNPLTQAITCNSGAPVTFSGTVSNPVVNVQHDWFSPLNPLPGGVPIATSNNTLSILSGEIPPGVYTLQTTNLVNGCKSSKTVTITSLSAFPTFSLGSPTNFSVGCAPLNQTTLSIINPISTQTPQSTCSFTFLAPSFTGVVTPSVQLDPNNSSTVTAIPGTWTVIVQDNSNFCRTQIAVPVLQNTFAPNVAADIMTQTLTCKNPTLLATGTSSTANTVITWNVPSNPPTLSTSTLIVGDVANGPATSTTALTYANFTVVATNSLNACISTSVVSVAQNFKPPVASAQISIATPTAIYCTVGKAPVVLSAGGSTTTSGGGPSAFPVVVLWKGPSPQPTMTAASNYSCYVPGIYSLTIMDNFNGCLHTGTVNVVDRTQPPPLSEAFKTSTLDCGQNSNASLEFKLDQAPNGFRFLVTEYPAGAAFSPTNAIVTNVNPLLSGTTSSLVIADKTGAYQYIVSNTLTGCQTTGTVNVIAGGLTAAFEASEETGYAPLTVNFNNNSASSAGSSSIVSIWNFGNGGGQTTASVGIGTSATYTAAGTYTVMLFTQKGACIDTAYKIIKVDIPSKLEIPNIFTPNGDGSNDMFFLKASNLTEITAVFFDRWGNKVYDVNSSTGNIAWDGKNLNGKECAAGVYFYHITAKGKDGTEYKEKGNVTIVK